MGIMGLDQPLSTWYGRDRQHGMGMRPCLFIPPDVQVCPWPYYCLHPYACQLLQYKTLQYVASGNAWQAFVTSPLQ